MRFASPQLDDERLRQEYETHYYPGSSEPAQISYENTQSEIIEQVFARLTANLGPLAGKRILDYGCGYGHLCRVAVRFGMVPVGIEQDENARHQANLQKITVYKDVAQLMRDDPGPKFDVIILWQVVEHLRTPWLELGRLRALLTPGGVAIISTPNAAGLKARILKSVWDNYVNPTHFFYFTPYSLNLTLRKAGFAASRRWRSFISYTDHGAARRVLGRVSAILGTNGELFYSAFNPS